MFEIIISRDAENDIKEASFWYALKRNGLDKEFFICVEAAISILKRSPELFTKLDDSNIRKINTQRFPYGVYYG